MKEKEMRMVLLKNKYDILLKELRKKEIKAIYYYLKMLSLESKILNNKNDNNKLNTEFINIINNITPYIITNSHFTYELSKDLNYLISKSSNNSSLLKFYNNYLNKIKYSIKFLLLLALLDNKNIKLKEITEVKTLLKILNCEKINELNLEKIDINKKQELLDNYHNNYMKCNIYPKTTTNNISKTKVLKLTKKILKNT